jgi:hypothetical protein
LFFLVLSGFSSYTTHLDIPEDEKRVFLKVHYYGNLLALIMFIAGFLWEVLIFHCRRLRK